MTSDGLCMANAAAENENGSIINIHCPVNVHTNNDPTVYIVKVFGLQMVNI